MADEEVAELVVNSSRSMHSTGFAGISAPRAVFSMIAHSLPRSAQANFLLLSSCAWKSVFYFYEPPVSFQHVQRLKFCASRVFGALEHSQV